MSQSIVLVEDDKPLADLIREYLAEFGYQTEWVADGMEAEALIVKRQPPLVIMDIMLPGQDGFSLCRAVRPKYPGPILFLTARSDQLDEIVGLEIGADDYLVKPVEPRLLVTRVRALLRRSSTPLSGQAGSPEQLCFGQLVIYPSSRTVELNGQGIELTTPQFDLLQLLATHAGQILSRQDILNKTRGIDYDGYSRTVDILVSQLRAKLEGGGDEPQLIKTVRNKGYMLAPLVAAE